MTWLKIKKLNKEVNKTANALRYKLASIVAVTRGREKKPQRK